MSKKKVGIVGVGLMGHGIASNIVKHGHALSILEHPGNQPLEALKASSARTYARACDLAAEVDVVILCVTGSPQVEDALLSDGGVLQGIKPGTVIVDCSTAIPTSTQRLAVLVAEAGGRFLDSAMTRTPKEAAEGRLNLLVGGDTQVLAEVRPVLECFAENITHVGAIGAGHSMKLLHNYVSLGSVALIAEAAACAERAGVPADVFIQVLALGGGGGTALKRLEPFLLAKDPSGLRFSVANASKDLGYYLEAAEGYQAAHTIADGVQQVLKRALQIEPAALMPELVALLPKIAQSANSGI